MASEPDNAVFRGGAAFIRGAESIFIKPNAMPIGTDSRAAAYMATTPRLMPISAAVWTKVPEFVDAPGGEFVITAYEPELLGGPAGGVVMVLIADAVGKCCLRGMRMRSWALAVKLAAVDLESRNQDWTAAKASSVGLSPRPDQGPREVMLL